ncbi:polysaccharide deacetylase family protein [Sneathiella sp.]|uniref:polysaccharide deacetylase family protein n=1 Tax=Sneathiella sp. TaxID=1964365 RepID=UPI0035625BB3
MTDWDDLKEELDIWQADRRVTTFWWRDDDLIAPTPALERLLHLRDHFEIPLSLAVIPDTVDPALADQRLDGCIILQHGAEHRNVAPAPQKKSEFPEGRPMAESTAVLAAGKERLGKLFEDRFLPALVPPWNRIAAHILPQLPALGYIGLSRFSARPAAVPVPGLVEVNTHIDPVNWRGDRKLLPLPVMLEMVCGHLRARRQKTVDTEEPTGLLTHHLVHDEFAWAELYKLISFLDGHPAVRWISLPTAISLADEIPEEAFLFGSED